MGPIFAVSSFTLVLVAAVLILLFTGFPIRISPVVIERGLALKLPLKRLLKGAGEIEVTSVRIDSSGQGDRLTVKVELVVGHLPAFGSIAGTVRVSAATRWEAAGALFLQSTRIEALSVQGLPDVLLVAVREMTTVAINELLEERPVWRIEPTTKALAAARALIRDVRVRNGSLELAIGGSASIFSSLARAFKPSGARPADQGRR